MEADLKEYQKKILSRLIGQFDSLNRIEISEFTPTKTMVCSKCNGSNLVKNGVFKGRQRYKCKDCKHTQFPDINTALYKLKLKDKWVDFVYIMLDKDQPHTCRKISDLLEINIKTAHQWRLKFLTAISEVEPIGDSQELELDEIYLPFCVKGRIGKEKYDEWYGKNSPKNVESALRKEEKIKEEQHHQSIYLCSHNRNNDFVFTPIKIQKKGVVSSDDLKRVNPNNLSDKTVITDSETSMKAFLKNYEGVNHQTFKSSDIKQGIMKETGIHNNNINNTMMRLKNWLKNFSGISTKYQKQYLNWFRFQNLFSGFDFDGMSIKQAVNMTFIDKNAYTNFKNIFLIYGTFFFL
jgi:transposase-like protein